MTPIPTFIVSFFFARRLGCFQLFILLNTLADNFFLSLVIFLSKFPKVKLSVGRMYTLKVLDIDCQITF